MIARWEKQSKIDISRRLLIKLIDSLERIPNLNLALRVYGHQKPVPPQDCSDTRLEVAFGNDNLQAIRNVIRELRPKGTTPIARSLEEAADDFPDDNCRRFIILFTDGIEACDGDPCEVSYRLQRKGVILEPFVIGIGLDRGFRKSFECVGKFYEVINETRFQEVLDVVITQILNTTSAQINLLDSYGRPTETNVNMTFYDAKTGAVRYNYFHTLNYRDNPDTLFLDPGYTYNLKIHTFPPLFLNDIKLQPGRHNVFAINAAMGYLFVKQPPQILTGPVKVIVKDKTTGSVINVQNTGERIRYLIGDYRVEILTMPVITIDSVNIRQSHTTTIEYPQPGIANFITNSEGEGNLFYYGPNGPENIHVFPENMRFHTLTLQPGKYMALFRPIGKQETMEVIKREFIITPGETSRVLLY